MLNIYIADLTHTYVMVSNETMPLPAGLIKSYLDSQYPGQVNIRMFRYPDTLINAIKESPPDVLMLSNYIWNESLNFFVMSGLKEIKPKALTIMGGPNFNLEAHKQEAFMRKHPCADIYVMREGEIPAAAIIGRYMACGYSIRDLKSTEIDNCYYIKTDGTFYNAPIKPGLKILDDIPSPWLNGSMDIFFDGKLMPIIETTRGCPFTCTFCVQGTSLYANVRRFSLERTQQELVYITEAIKRFSPQVGALSIADANFGMYQQDVKFSAFIGELQKEYGWPVFIGADTGKNKTENILQTVSNLNGALLMGNAMQSMSPKVLENVKRKNISLEVGKLLRDKAAELDVGIHTEMILSLPGETYESHRDGIFSLIENGVEQFTCYQTMLLKGSELELDEHRQRYKLESQYRLLPRSLGVYDGQKVFEVEEIVSETVDLSYKDYLEARKFHLLSKIYYEGFRFRPLTDFLEQNGITILMWIKKLLEDLDSANSGLKAVFKDFVKETDGELFDSYEECVGSFSQEENFQKLLSGEIGGNLIFKYLTIATFYAWGSMVEHAFATARKLLAGKEYNEAFLEDIETYMRHRLADGKTKEQILSVTEGTLKYDIQAWCSKKSEANSFDNFKFAMPRKVQFSLPKKKYDMLKNAIQVYGEDINGISKVVTRINYTDQFREYDIKDPVSPSSG